MTSTTSLSFHKIVLSFLSFVLLFLFNCKKDPISSAPLEATYILEDTKTIGQNGGSIELSDFVLTIPSGAFDSDYQLEIYTSSTDKPFGENSVSRMFKIEGLPVNQSNTLQVRVMYDGTLTEESYIALGEEVNPMSLTELKTAYHLLNATDSLGWLVGDLPTNTGISKSREQSEFIRDVGDVVKVVIGVVSGYAKLYSANGHFAIKYPPLTVARSDVEALGGFLEEAYTEFHDNMGFDYSARMFWSVEVVVGPFILNPNAFGFSVNSKLGNNFGWLEINSAFLNDLDLIRVTAGHEFFHLVQSLYDPRNSWSKARSQPEHLWLNEAMSVWSEERFTDHDKYVSTLLNDNDYEPFRGMHISLDVGQEDSQNHGYGMVPMIEYLAKNFGTSSFVKMYEEIYKGVHPVEAIVLSTSHPSEWLEMFFREYILGNLYGRTVQDIIGLRKGGNLNISSPNDTLIVYPFSYEDLSAELHQVKLNYTNMDEKAAISFSLSGGSGASQLTIFKYNSSAIEYLGHSAFGDLAPQVTISNVRKELIDKGWHFLVLVTNSRAVSPYTDTKSIDLKISVGQKFDISNSKKCNIGIGDVVTQTLFSNGTTGKWTLYKGWEVESGSWNGNIFSGAYSGDTISVTINPSTKKITNFYAKYSDAYGEELIIEGEIPFEPDTNDGYYSAIFSSNGVAVCDNITNIAFSNSWGTTITGWDCNAASSVEIRFVE